MDAGWNNAMEEIDLQIEVERARLQQGKGTE